MLVLVAVTLIILLVAAAFSVDVAFMQLARQELHVATDAAAKAAVTKLSQGGSQGQAKQAAVDCAAANSVGGKALSIDSTNVDLGRVTYSQTGYWTFTKDATPLSAARVTVNMVDGTTAGPVNLFFGRILGTSKFNPLMTSTAAFVRNKVCFCFDRSRSMTFDLSGVDERWPSGTGWPNGVPSSLTTTKKQLYPPCNGSRWASLSSAANLFLDVLGTSSVQTPVALVTWADSASYSSYYQGTTYKTSSISFNAVDTDSTFVTDYATVRTAITNRGGKTMLGGTNMASGLQRAINLFASTEDGTPWNKIIILFSDGQWNAGTDPIATARTAAGQNIVVHTVGLLSGGDNGTMRNIATTTGGLYFYAPNGASLQSAFEQLARTLPVILTQ
jgi:Flp pilus assembly protein TadG